MENGKLRLDRVLSCSMFYPGNYGYIENTLAEDGDALDVIIINNYELGSFVTKQIKEIDWSLEDLGYHPYKSKQPNGYSDLSNDWLSTELIIRRLMFSKRAFERYNFKDQGDNTIHEKIIHKNFDNPEKILKILSKAKSNKDKHMILFNLPEVLRA